ncbi:hypothetical protein T11_3508 [Trichinella zimbabwensis]|uniref:Uncharacterized protein n=1 Tax=Trichinella zimbabwensis TaxID=268475 RepID=A0A0V1HSV8_9BILA|nr:hypothetical protein T11_3508 [Trichinella zimbabwensis]
MSVIFIKYHLKDNAIVNIVKHDDLSDDADKSFECDHAAIQLVNGNCICVLIYFVVGMFEKAAFTTPTAAAAATLHFLLHACQD